MVSRLADRISAIRNIPSRLNLSDFPVSSTSTINCFLELLQNQEIEQFLNSKTFCCSARTAEMKGKPRKEGGEKKSEKKKEQSDSSGACFFLTLVIG